MLPAIIFTNVYRTITAYIIENIVGFSVAYLYSLTFIGVEERANFTERMICDFWHF